MKRDQKNQELLYALIDIAAKEGVVTEYEATKLKDCRNYGEAVELAQGFNERRN